MAGRVGLRRAPEQGRQPERGLAGAVRTSGPRRPASSADALFDEAEVHEPVATIITPGRRACRDVPYSSTADSLSHCDASRRGRLQQPCRRQTRPWVVVRHAPRSARWRPALLPFMGPRTDRTSPRSGTWSSSDSARKLLGVGELKPLPASRQCRARHLRPLRAHLRQCARSVSSRLPRREVQTAIRRPDVASAAIGSRQVERRARRADVEACTAPRAPT